MTLFDVRGRRPLFGMPRSHKPRTLLCVLVSLGMVLCLTIACSKSPSKIAASARSAASVPLVSAAQTDTPEPTHTLTATATAEATFTPTSSPTPEPTATHTPTATATDTPEPTSTQTPLPTPTASATATPASTTEGCPDGCNEPREGCQIKGNISSKGEKIYHVPGGRYYDKTVISPEKGERWFCTEEEAQAAGWRRSQQ